MTNEWKIEVKTIAESLAIDFQRGPIINEKGLRRLDEKLVGNINGLRLEIFSNEHPPPHFRVYYAGESANFTIKDCTKLNGGLNKWERNIRAWHVKHKNELIEIWNKSRPADCPVGNYFEN